MTTNSWRRHTFLVITGPVLLLCLLAKANAADDAQIPDGLLLLPGYHYTRLDSDDSLRGIISKSAGMTIQFDVPSYADVAGGGGAWVIQEINSLKKKELLWIKKQRVHGLSVEIALTKNRRLLVAYPQADAGFWANARTEEEVADALLMVLTYRAPPALPVTPS